MRNIVMLSVALGLAIPTAQAGETAAPPDKPRPLTGLRCLTPDRSSGWTYLDDSHILIDGGNRKYRMEFDQACWGLKFEMSLAFKGDPFTGRVCGDLGDEVITKTQHCRIKSMEIITTEQYRQAIRDNKAAIEARKLERASKKSNSP
jgi:hypothetical protein